MDNADIEAEAREYVERVARNSRQDLESIPAGAFERALKTAAASARELHTAVRLAQEARREEGKRRPERRRDAGKPVAG